MNLGKNSNYWSELLSICVYSTHTFLSTSNLTFITLFIPMNKIARVPKEVWSAKGVKRPKSWLGQAVCDHQSFGVRKRHQGSMVLPRPSFAAASQTDRCPLLEGTTRVGGLTWTSYWLHKIFTAESLSIAASLLPSAYDSSALGYSSVILNSKIWNMNLALKMWTGLWNTLKADHCATLGQAD